MKYPTLFDYWILRGIVICLWGLVLFKFFYPYFHNRVKRRKGNDDIKNGTHKIQPIKRIS